MRNNETGEFELVVGNGQLLSGFFIVILLCAVMFALGFVVARAKYQQDAVMGGAATSAGSLRPQPGGAVQPSTPPPSEAPPAAASVPADQAPQPQAQPETAAPPDTASKPPEAAPVAAEGKYWQVSATANEDSARALLRTLKDAGFPASLSPGPNNLTRVLVGPYTDTGSMGRAKTELEAAGFSTVKH